MTEEQIKKNAADYVYNFQPTGVITEDRLKCYIAGAHSMDYEIGTLKCKVRELWENIEEQEKTIENLEDQLQKLKGGKQ